MHKAFVKHISRYSLFLVGLCAFVFSTQSFAQSVHLSLCIDGSGSVGAANFDLQLSGTADAIQDVVPTDGSVELSAIIFASAITPIDLNGAAAGNSIIITSQGDKDDVEEEIVTTNYPGGLTNIQGCISQAMVQMGCDPAVAGGTPTCPSDDITRIIDISTDGDPTENNYDSDGTNNCGTGAGISECNEDTNDAAVQAFNAGVNIINVIGIGGGPTVSNMITWAFNNNLPYDIALGAPSALYNEPQVFDPGDIFDESGLQAPPLPTDLTAGYSSGPTALPVFGDSGYVVLVADFSEYQPTINAKIFNELNIQSDISVVKTVDQATVSPGGTLTYTLAVTNNGAVDVPDVVVTDILPSGVTFVSADNNPSTGDVACTHDGSPTGGEVTCDVTTLSANGSPGDAYNIDVVVTVN